MAKYECELRGDFNRLLRKIDQEILSGSKSASREDGSDYQVDDTRCAVRVYERYSMMGENRVSLNVTLVGKGDKLFVSAISAGGSKAIFYKINTIGEENFLRRFVDIIEDYKRIK